MAGQENPFDVFIAPPDAGAPMVQRANPFDQFVPGADIAEEHQATPAFKSKIIGTTEFGMPIFEDEEDNRALNTAHTNSLKGILLGFAKGLHDVPMSILQMGSRGAEALLPEGKAKEYMTGERRALEEDIARSEKDFRDAADPEVAGVSEAARLGGNALMTAPVATLIPGAGAAGLIRRMVAGGAGGAIGGAASRPVEAGPDTNFLAAKGTQTAAGAVGGAVMPVIGGAVARMISPNVRPEVRTMMEAGVRPTPGQIVGGMGNRLEEAATSIPVLGDFISNARRRAVEDFNRGAVNHSLEPIGAQLAHDVPVGREAIGTMHQTIGDAYDAITPHLNVQMDPQFARDYQPILQMRAGMSNPSQETFDRIIDNEVARRFSATGAATGQQYRDMERELGRQATAYIHSQAPSDQEVGRALQQMQLRLRDLLVRSNPAHATELNNIHNAFAHALRVEGAAAKTGAEGGTFTPAQFSQSVRALDPTLRKNAYARGDALMQDYSDAGRAVLGDRLPNSGTPYRGMSAALTGLGSLSLHDPMLAAAIAGGGAGVAGAYSRPSVSLLAHLLAARGPLAGPTATAIRYPGNASLAGILASQAANAPAGMAPP